MKMMSQFSGESSGLSMKGATMPTRLLSRSRPDAVFARCMILSMLLLLVMFLVYRLVTVLTTDEAKLLRGKLVILSLAIIIGTGVAMIAPAVLTTIY